MNPHKPIVFACAGCYFAAELSWKLAKELDRRDLAEMSCLAGVGAQKQVFLKKLRDREAWVIDGCPIECGKGIFSLVNIPIERHIQLANFGFMKNCPPKEGVDMAKLINRILALELDSTHIVACGSNLNDWSDQ